MDVLILMGSDSDADVMSAAGVALNEFGLTWEMTVASAHRSPARVLRLIDDAHTRGVKVFIVGAGAAAHLAGVVAAPPPRPVVGVPTDPCARSEDRSPLFAAVRVPPLLVSMPGDLAFALPGL